MNHCCFQKISRLNFSVSDMNPIWVEGRGFGDCVSRAPQVQKVWEPLLYAASPLQSSYTRLLNTRRTYGFIKGQHVVLHKHIATHERKIFFCTSPPLLPLCILPCTFIYLSNALWNIIMYKFVCSFHVLQKGSCCLIKINVFFIINRWDSILTDRF